MKRLSPPWRIVACFVILLLAGRGRTTHAQALDSASAGDAAALDAAAAGDKPALPTETVELLPASTLSLAGAALPTARQLSVPLNQRVLSYIELFQTRLHDFMETGMRRGAQYLPMIQKVFTSQGLPPDLAYVPLVESAFRPDAISRASAKGVWQFMTGTALENGLRHDFYVDERSNPEKATIAAANYLKSLADTFGGDWQLALASYNSGPGRVQQAIKRVGRADFWSLAARPWALPRETREYVPMILAAIVIARNPAQYGFSFDALPQLDGAPQFETVRLPHAVELKKVAEWTGTPVETLKELNPELRRPMTPFKDPDYALRVPVGTSIEIARRMDEAAGDDLLSLTRYTVRSGDTLAGIARKLHISRSDLAEANELSVTARLATGQELIVPAGVPYVSYAPRKSSSTSASRTRKAPARKTASKKKTTHRKK
ncbi:MAG TPA: transglycosylase SLT domain-containing protein [Vicinamibacterales bacterium]|nr:transglycosylase SLT domain-containing protein [Vicinamibacterales bacterium]